MIEASFKKQMKSVLTILIYGRYAKNAPDSLAKRLAKFQFIVT